MMVAENLGLFGNLPVQRAPSTGFVNLHTLVPHLMELYDQWSETDLMQFLEEKTGRRLHPEDDTTLRAVYQRCRRLRQEFEPQRLD
jgi:hypothetical protein